MNKELLVNQMEALKTTMELAVVNEQAIDMKSYITHYVNGMHMCDSVCCVIGDQVIYGDLTYFETTSDLKFASVSFKLLAIYAACDLDNACEDFLGDEGLSESIWMSRTPLRKDGAKRSELFTPEELDSLPHLNTEPTAQDVVDYLTLCIAKVEALS